MRKLMLLLLFLATSFGLPVTAVSQTYTVAITVNDVWWQSQENWGGDFTATIYCNGNPIPNSTNYFYQWYFYSTHWAYWSTRASGCGLNETTYETYMGTNLYGYVVVTDTVNHTFTGIQSPQTREYSMPAQGSSPFSFNAYQQDGGSINSLVSPYHWRYTINQWRTGFNNHQYLTNNYDEIIQAIPTYVSSIGQKMNYWNGMASNILNHDSFYITGITSLTAQYGSVDGTATIQSQVTDANVAAESLDFMDPWLPDYPDPNYGNNVRNQGMSAPFKSVAAGTNNIGINTAYKGVFLNQSGPPNWTPPYYSVRAPLVQTFYGGYAGFFSNWNVSGATLRQIAPNPTGYDQKAVVFTASGATVTANYKYYTVSQNTTLAAGTYYLAGSLTVNAGVALTLNAGVTLNFPYGAGLTVNGTLAANGATFNFIQGSYPYTSGITINTNGSSLTNCTISGGDRPLAIYNTSNVSIDGGTITNSYFNSGQAIYVENSTPSISRLTVAGGSYSSNGVRFTNSSGGTLGGCTVQNCGVGNGIIVQGNSSPNIVGNTVNNNYFHGILVLSNGTGNPTIVGNTVTGLSNGSKPYNGVNFYWSTGKIGGNTVTLANYGFYFDTYSSPSTYWQGAYSASVGSNTATGNRYGLIAYYHSYPVFGSGVAAKGTYYGICNNIYGNDYYDGYAYNSSGITAEFNWWGTSPRYYADGNSYVDYSNAESGPNNCPTGGGVLASVVGSPSSNSHVDPQTLLAQALEERENGHYAEAKRLYRAVLSDASAAQYHQRAVTLLYNLFQVSGDTTIVDDLEHESGASDLLASAYAALGRSSDAETIAKKLEVEHSGEEIEQRSLITQASLSAFDRKHAEQSKAAFNRLVNKYGKSIDAGVLAALSMDHRTTMRKIGNPEAGKDSTVKPTSITLENFPNPFNPTTVVSYQLPEDSKVSLSVYDILGREVATLVDEQVEAGYHTATFDASHLASGLYFARLSVTSANGSSAEVPQGRTQADKMFVQTVKMLLAK